VKNAPTTDEPFAANRRGFLAGGASLVISLSLGMSPREAAAAGSSTQIGAFIEITNRNKINVLVPSTEMGQGIMTGLSQLVAEELMVDWPAVTASHAPAGAVYANPLMGIQITSGSTSMRGWFTPLRLAAATAREMLITAGAHALNAPRKSCIAAHGRIYVAGTTRSVAYGEIVGEAAKLRPPPDPPLVSKFRLIGTPAARLDIPSKVDGSAIYGIDVRLPGMLYAAVKHCPTMGGTVASMPSRPAGAVAVINLGNAIAVVAHDTGAAKSLSEGLSVEWNIPPASAQLDSALIQSKAEQLLASGKPQVAEHVGSPDSALASSAKKIDSTYSLPYLAHACLEPLNCTALVTAKSCEIWAPTQSPMMVMSTAQALTGLPPDKITVHTTFLGGGLGRKFEQDYIAQAIKVSHAMKGPVKTTWPREQDFTNDQYRPMALVGVQAGIDNTGQIKAWIYRF
jgi:isoquinoline 1-oxidoreductase beta subunit